MSGFSLFDCLMNNGITVYEYQVIQDFTKYYKKVFVVIKYLH